MQQVDIFLYISSKAPRINGASYIYVLTCGKKYISGKGEVKEITTRNRSTLICATEALKRMNKPALITIHTNNQYIVDNHMRLDSWEKKAGQIPEDSLLKTQTFGSSYTTCRRCTASDMCMTKK